MLFQEKDRKRVRSDQINYEYFEERNEDPASMEMAFCRSLRELVPRLELLGFTLDQAKREYAVRVEAWREEDLDEDEEGRPQRGAMTFEEFCAFATAHPLQDLDDTFVSEVGDAAEAQIRGRFADKIIADRVPRPRDHDRSTYSERSYFGSLVNFLHPYTVLRILALNEANLDADVVWQFGPLVDAGWAGADEFVPGARRGSTFLVATEGSSDAHILKHALTLLRPEIEDFFRFIDVTERHPFPGTGNLLKFAEGLAKIDVHNQVIFLFDNDAEGFEAYQKILLLRLPPNMQAMMLPELEEFRAFPARGPDGVNIADINRRAAAIECYLDLAHESYRPARVIWTNYKKDLDVYHGSLEFKESYMRKFLDQAAGSLSTGSYDVTKLRVVLDALVNECSSMAAKAVI
jgi:hypothetical protein